MRVMLDTNILVSAFVFRSRRFYAVINYIVLCHELILSSYIIDELKDVVRRKFPNMTGE
ncbi:MAG: PIN domain-containing protein [Clostridiales bacterium]|jgi:predicted nucleic acid-binding protein|nr:PIN domain-containing protein [Clostridiales bacterium]